MIMVTNALTAYLAIGLTFVAVMLAAYALGLTITRDKTKARIAQIAGAPAQKVRRSEDVVRMPAKTSAFLDALSKLSLPAEGWQNSELRLKFIRAGFRDESAPRIYFAVKSFLSILAPLALGAALLFFKPDLGYLKISLFVLCIAAAGYYGPDLYLKSRTASRSKEMQQTLPDLLDLLVICIESGLGLDAAMNRVSREIARSSPVLSEEFYLVSLEIRAGAGRIAALKNLALRIHLEDMYSLVSMLVQADKFGTSLGASLRIQSEVMRVKRMQRAEEIAAKIPVKMLFPLILFIFPSLMFVILGPAFLQIMRTMGKG
jgi:tight adherence protein C